MESFAKGLAANLFAAPLPPAGTAPVGAGLAGLFGEAFSPGGAKSAKINEFLGVLDASAPPLDLELSDLAAAPGSLVEITDRANAQPADGSSAPLVLANTERLLLGGAASDDSERTVLLTTDERIGPVQRFMRSDKNPLANIASDVNSRAAILPTDKPSLVDLAGRAAPSDDGVELPPRFETQRSQSMASALSANKFKTAAPLMALALADKATVEPGLVARDDNLPLIQTLNAVSERASAAPTMSPLSEAATKPAAQIVAAISSRGMDTSIEVRLDPPELGRVTIDFEGRGGDIIRATVAAEAPDTLELMRRNIDILQRELEKSGLANIDLQFRERGPQSDANFSDERFGAGLQYDDALGMEMSDMPHHIAALSLDGRLDRLL
jgi:Flagellar hook-length control protein FliK